MDRRPPQPDHGAVQGEVPGGLRRAVPIQSQAVPVPPRRLAHPGEYVGRPLRARPPARARLSGRFSPVRPASARFHRLATNRFRCTGFVGRVACPRRTRRGSHFHGPPGCQLRSRGRSSAAAASGQEAKRRTCSTICANFHPESSLVRRTKARHCTFLAGSERKASVSSTGFASTAVPRRRNVNRMASIKRAPRKGYSRDNKARS